MSGNHFGTKVMVTVTLVTLLKLIAQDKHFFLGNKGIKEFFTNIQNEIIHLQSNIINMLFKNIIKIMHK